jgi:hypothetical protein
VSNYDVPSQCYASSVADQCRLISEEIRCLTKVRVAPDNGLMVDIA